ncbi:hypothetical protein CPB86DRAFT_733925 [Serendipita vermifera]|nr:hypothetical protein CPB86DRAFT_733925 [Serendipita vermifera]
MSTNIEPQTEDVFDAATAAQNGSARGFPLGYFVIRSLATGKLLDVPTHSIKDGTEIILWDEKEKALVENMRRPEADNQVFFMDESGALCGKHSGHAVDVEDGMLVLRHRRPIQAPYPSAVSHSLPAFSYDPVTGHISVSFESDPAYPPPAPPPKHDFELVSHPSKVPVTVPSGATAWKQKCYLLTSIPSQKPRTFVDDAAEFFASSASIIAAPFAAIPNPFASSEPPVEEIFNGDQDAKILQERVSLEHVRAGHFDLLDEEVVEEERAEEAEIDDDPNQLRRVRVIGYRKRTEVPNSKARDRKRWEILPIRKERRRY